MDNQEIKKLLTFVKVMPEAYKILKRFILDYLDLKEQNQKLVNANLILLDDIEQYKHFVKEQLNTEITIH